MIAYGVSFPDMFRRAGRLCRQNSQGARRSDLRVEQPIKFETILNLKTAKAIDFDVPTAFLLRADEVIE
jgi:putative tryptophan/tyrosine transport system substrate-binding protein